jgi:hypothetical protein
MSFTASIFAVIAGLDAPIQANLLDWMPGSSPGHDEPPDGARS